MNNVVFANVRKHRDTILLTKEEQGNTSYHTTKFFTENLLAMQMKKTQILMNKSLYLGLSLLELRKILMYEFWYDRVKNMVKKQNCVTWI